MIDILHSEIPEYLHYSAFYSALASSDDEVISVPSDCLKIDDFVTNVVDAHQLLMTARFWGLDTLPLTIFVFIMTSKDRDLVTILSEFNEPFEIIKCALAVHDSKPSERMRKAITSGHVQLVQALQVLKYPWDGARKAPQVELSTATAAGLGHLHLLVYLHEQDAPLDESTTLAAAQHGHLSCLQYLHEQGCPWDERCGGLAANGGHLECLQYCHTHGVTLTAFVAEYAAMNGHLHCVKYIADCGLSVSFGVVEIALINGCAECFRYAVETGTVTLEDPEPLSYYAKLTSRRNQKVITEADMLACLQYAVSIGYIGLVVNLGHVLNIIEYGLVDCLRYYREVVFPEPFPPYVAAHAAQYGQLDCLQYITTVDASRSNTVTNHAINHGHLECLKYAHEHGYPWLQSEPMTLEVVSPSAGTQRRQLLSCFQYAIEHGYKCTDSWIPLAAGFGQLDALQYAVQCDASFVAYSVMRAITGAHLDCVEYLHSLGQVDLEHLPYGMNIFPEEAGPCLHFLVSKVSMSAPFARDIARWAVEYDDAKLLAMVEESGCEMSEDLVLKALGCNAWACVVYLFEQECTMNKTARKECECIAKLF